MSTLADPLETGREAYAQRRWVDALELLRAADGEGGLEPEDVERLAWATAWSLTPAEAVPIFERAYAAHLDAGNVRRAAAIAVQLAHEYGSVRLQRSVGSGWLGRAARLLADEPEGREHGYLALERGLIAQQHNRFDEALEHARLAERIGRATGDRGLEIRALQREGVALAYQGAVEEGKALLDEAAAAAVGGELDPYSTLAVYCNAIGTCRDVAAFDEAAQWTDLAQSFCDDVGANAFPGMCRVNRAEVLRFEGRLVEAEETAASACRELEHWAPRIAAAAHCEVGEARLRLGDLARAEEAFDAADDLGRDPEPGRSLLLLARGKEQSALASIRRALADDSLALPARARLLPALVEIAAAAGEPATAAGGADELRRISGVYDTTAMNAAAEQACGISRLAAGDHEAAVAPLRRALRLWQQSNARYEAARARVFLARAYRLAGDEEAAMRELARAGSVFDQLGARLDAEQTDLLLGRNAGSRVTMTFGFTDIVDSTRHLEHFGDEIWNKLLHRHDDLVRRAVDAAGGRIVEPTGDGFFLAFDSPAAAVEAARAIQRAADDELPFAIRIGLHTDEATNLGENYRGKGVHVAARVAALASGCEILMSRTTAEAAGVDAATARAVELKGLADPVEVVALRPLTDAR